MRNLALLVVVVAACGKSSGDTKPSAPARTERTDVIAREGTPLTLLGPTLDVGDSMPDVAVYDAKLTPIQLGSLKGKIVVLSVVPSIDTRVCESQTHHMSNLMTDMPPNVEVMTVSRDLPFAQQRFAEEAMTKTRFGSDYKEREFGRAFGVDVKETGLLARSVWVIGTDGKVAYRQLVANQASEPDYDALMAAVKRAAGA
ncbi:MAG TPA: thiol peroxidase [Kofleriaceae bacterium]|nr:thiol peroxidase [Kofleriaceae bacterium]